MVMELDKRNIPVILYENKLDASLGKINISVKLIQLYETEDGYRHCLKEYLVLIIPVWIMADETDY